MKDNAKSLSVIDWKHPVFETDSTSVYQKGDSYYILTEDGGMEVGKTISTMMLEEIIAHIDDIVHDMLEAYR